MFIEANCENHIKCKYFTCAYNFKSPDIDECLHDELNVCHHYAECNNTFGNYTCSCRDGYAGDGLNCTGEIDYIVQANTWNSCNTVNTSFTDIDECHEGTHECSINAYCTNTDGGHNCTCSTGYRGTGYTCGKNLLLFHIFIGTLLVICT